MREMWNAAAKEGGPGPRPTPEWAEYFASHKEYVAARREGRKWSKEHSRQDMSKWSDKFTARQTSAYYSAYVNDPWRFFGVTGRRHGAPWHKYYVVDIGGFMTEDEYEASYPLAA
jgi:hypothetical protein